MTPAESRNYFSAAFFGRDIFLPLLNFGFIFAEVIFLFPEVRSITSGALTDMNSFSFIFYAYLWLSTAVVLSYVTFRFYSAIIQVPLSILTLGRTDYPFYYQKLESEIDNLMQELLKDAAGIRDNRQSWLSTLRPREKANMLLALVPLSTPTAYVYLQRLWGLHSIVIVQMVSQFAILASLIITKSYYESLLVGLSALSLILVLARLTRLISHTEINTLRGVVAFEVLMKAKS